MYLQTVTVPIGTPELHNHRGHARIVYKNRECIDPEIKVDDLIRRLETIREEHKDKYTNLYIDSEQDCGCYHDCRCSPSYYVWGTREETDLEYNFRAQERARQAEEAEKRDRKVYEELKKRFGE